MTYVWEDPRRVLARHQLLPQRSFSQNFLISERAVRAIATACERGREHAILELGAGCGTLTQALAQYFVRVYALERDPNLVELLQQECDPARVQVVPGDAKQVRLEAYCLEGCRRVSVAGNLPYAITGAILRNLVEQSDRVEEAVLMVQREVRDRLVAQPDTSEYGALTVFTQQVFLVESVVHVPKTAFHPVPKVSSSVLRLRPLPVPRAERGIAFERVVHASFQARRKTLRNALVQAFGAADSDAALAAAGIDGKRRGETLAIEEFGALARALAHAGAG